MLTILKPSLLVGVGVHRRGGVTYARTVLEDEDEGSGNRKRWETEKRIQDRDEHERAEKEAGRIRRRITKLCQKTSFGFLCTLDKEDELDALLAAMKAEAQVVSQGLTTCTLTVSSVKGRIAPDDHAAAAALAGEVARIMEKLQQAIAGADAKTIRAVLTDAKGLELLLEGDQGVAVKAALDVARKAAKDIVKGMVKQGKPKADVVQGLNVRPLNTARMMFLELERHEEMVAAPMVSARLAVAANE